MCFSFSSTRDGWRCQKGLPTSFSPVPYTNQEISPQNFLTFSFNPFAHLCKISRPYLVPFSNIELELRPPRKKKGFSGDILMKLSL